jgi:hypothetical protein
MWAQATATDELAVAGIVAVETGNAGGRYERRRGRTAPPVDGG